MLDDALFSNCVYQSQILHAKTSRAHVYAYLFSHKGQSTPSYAVAYSESLSRSGFHHPLVDTSNPIWKINHFTIKYHPLSRKIK